MVGNCAQRNKDEEDVEPGIEEEVAVAGNPAGLAVSDEESTDTLGKWKLFAGRLVVADTIVAAGAVAGEEAGMLRGWHFGRGNEGACIRECLREASYTSALPRSSK